MERDNGDRVANETSPVIPQIRINNEDDAAVDSSRNGDNRALHNHIQQHDYPQPETEASLGLNRPNPKKVVLGRKLQLNRSLHTMPHSRPVKTPKSKPLAAGLAKLSQPKAGLAIPLDRKWQRPQLRRGDSAKVVLEGGRRVPTRVKTLSSGALEAQEPRFTESEGLAGLRHRRTRDMLRKLSWWSKVDVVYLVVVCLFWLAAFWMGRAVVLIVERRRASQGT